MDQKYNNQCVRDLAWSLSSPALMLPDDVNCRWYDDDWYSSIYADAIDWLHDLDERPEALLAAISAERDRRLGKYFETLWAFYFSHSERFSIIEHNRQIIDGEQTLGELDFIVFDRQRERTIHLELAIKFYLGVGDTTEQGNWHGAGKKDRLDSKMQTLLERQSLFAKHQVVKESLRKDGIEVDECGVIMKGRLFYPSHADLIDALPNSSNTAHLRHKWYTFGNFALDESISYMPLTRSGWMASQEYHSDECFDSMKQFENMINNGVISLPIYLLGFSDGVERERLFVVPDDWTNGLVKT